MSNLSKYLLTNSLPRRASCFRRGTTLLVALALASAPVEAHAAPPASESAAAATTVRVVVDASALGEGSEYFETEIARKLAEGLVAEGFEVVESGESTVRIKLDYFDERDRDFLISTDVVREGRMAVSQKPSKCPSCIDDELVDAAVAMLPELIEVLRADASQLPTEGPGDPPPGDGDGDGDGDVETPPTVKPIGPVGITGAVIGVVGLGALIGGVVELSRGEVRDDDPSMLDSTGQDHAPAGKVLVGVGAGVLVVGIVMLGVDVGMRAKKRKEARRTSVLPVLGPNNAGLVLQGRF